MKKQRTVVLTGANGILGAAYVAHYLKQGLRVAALDRFVDKLKPLERRQSKSLLVLKTDLSDRGQVKGSVAAVLKRFGVIDAVHHNCASKPEGFFAPTADYDLEAWREVFAANLETALLLTQEVIPHFKKRRQGSFLFTASVYGIAGADPRIYEGSLYAGRPINTPAAYSASKASIVGLVRHLACELGPWNIRVNSLTPGGVFSGQNGVFQKKYSARVPLGRMARAEEMVAPALFLISEGASYVTGHNLVVDGGLTAW